MKLLVWYSCQICLVLLGLIPSAARADDETMLGKAVEHHDHANFESLKKLIRTEARYKIPTMTLIRDDGVKVVFPAGFDNGKPVIINFIFTSCTTVCPILSHVFSQVQKNMGARAAEVSMMSFTIDPEYDTPERLKLFAEKLKAGPQWRHFTGKLKDIIKLQQVFQVYTGDKMSHPPVTFMKIPKSDCWIRLNGVATSEEILSEYSSMIGPNAADACDR